MARTLRSIAWTALAAAPCLAGASSTDPIVVQGVTVSCQTNGREWATDAFAAEVDVLREHGANWIAIHPYARIASDGAVSFRAFDEGGPAHVLRPIAEAHARCVSILIHPHLAQWGSRFRERGDVAFELAADRERFWSGYHRWIVALAAAARAADAFAIGSETDRLTADEARWRALIADVRAVTAAKLTYAANWNAFERVPFWDALDAVGVQAYFPLSTNPSPTDDDLARGWDGAIARLRAVHERTGKPVVLTELGYNRSLDAAREPWAYATARGESALAAEALQARCLRTALAAIERERSWLRGAFLWKWFVGPAPGENFLLNEAAMRAVIREQWAEANEAER